MDVKDYYETLGVSRSADQKEIRRAFRKLARKYHPDVNPGDAAAEDRFKEINEAYEVLSDPEKREKYDRFGAQWRQYERMGEQAQDFDWSQWQARPGAGAGRARTVSPEEFEQMFGGSAGGGFSDFFETLFGGGRSGFGGDFGGATGRQPRPQAGRDVEHEVQITLEEAFHGTTRTLQYERGRQIEARIPPGVKTGSRIRLSGQGQEGFGGGQAGDLYLRVQVLPNDRFERDGADLRTTVDVELYTALLGGDIPVSSIDRTVRLSIPPETGNGRVFRLNGLGMPHVNKPDKRGDLFAEVSVQLPQNLSEREKELFAELQEMRQ